MTKENIIIKPRTSNYTVKTRVKPAKAMYIKITSPTRKIKKEIKNEAN